MSALALAGRVALVTGAARGIGLATAHALHARGAAVVLVDVDAGATARAAAAVGERALGVAADVTRPEAIGAAVAAGVERFGGLDVCIANAGISPRAATLRAMDPSAFERVVEVNLLGTYRTVRAALPQIVERAGHVAIVASIYAFYNGMLMTPYAASKAGIEQLGRALRIELAPHGASAGVAYYGFIETEMVKASMADPVVARFEAEHVPGFVRRRLSPDQAAQTLVAGVERRAARVYAPPWLRGYSTLRGVLNPLIDARLARDRRLHELIREGDRERA